MGKALHSSLIALMSGLVMLVALAQAPQQNLDYGAQFQSAYCEKPCCQGNKVEKSDCCCVRSEAPVNNNVPAGLISFNGSQSLDLDVAPRPLDALISEARFQNMVGFSTGLARAAPPPVKLFILNEALLC